MKMTMRPLSADEQRFAAQNHDLVYAFLHEKGLPFEVFYDVAIFGYLRAVQEYLTDPRFVVYAFSTIAWKRMQSSVTSYCRAMAAPSRSAPTVSLSDPIGTDDALTWEDILSRRDEGFLHYETRLLMDGLHSRLLPQQMRIVRMKLDGFRMHEIARREHMTFREINRLLADSRDEIVRILWGDESEAAA